VQSKAEPDYSVNAGKITAEIIQVSVLNKREGEWNY